MTQALSDQFKALRRIAAFSAAIRGHKMGEWRMQDGFALAACTQCGAELCMYFPALYPEMDGPALEACCDQSASEQVA